MQRVSDLAEGQSRYVAFAALDSTDVCSVEFGLVSESLLGPVEGFASLANTVAKMAKEGGFARARSHAKEWPDDAYRSTAYE